MDDLLALAAMAAGPAPAVVEGMLLPDLDLDMLVAVAANAPGDAAKRQDQRSWQLAEKARAAKKQKRADLALAAAVSTKERAQAHVVLLGTLVPAAVARAVGAASNRGLSNMTRKVLICRFPRMGIQVRSAGCVSGGRGLIKQQAIFSTVFYRCL